MLPGNLRAGAEKACKLMLWDEWGLAWCARKAAVCVVVRREDSCTIMLQNGFLLSWIILLSGSMVTSQMDGECLYF